jgi:hypothetical protein
VVQGEESWWQRVIGSEPEAVIRQPPRGFLRQEADFRNGKLFLTSLPDRIDWLWQTIDKPDLEGPDLATLGPSEEAIAEFSKLLERWFPICPIASRLALGLELIQPVDSVTQGYERLQHYLKGITLDVGGSSDLMYRINRPRPSRVPELAGLQINRLSTWSVVQPTLVSLTISIPQITRPTANVSPSARPICKLELDINTAQGYQDEILSDQIAKLFKEFVELAAEIAERGDVK